MKYVSILILLAVERFIKLVAKVECRFTQHHSVNGLG